MKKKKSSKTTVKKEQQFVVVDLKKSYPIAEAIELAKKLSKTKFDSSVEVHIRLGIDTGKGEQQVRSVVVLPHGTGKSKRVAVITEGTKQDDARAAGADLVGGEELIKTIKEKGSIDAEIVISTPDMMAKLAQIAKILGPKGLMPNPKNETITTDIGRAVKEMKGGKVAFKNDDTGNVHQIIGKMSWESQKLVENFNVFLEAVRKVKPSTSKGSYFLNVVVSTTMGPGIKVAV